MMKIINAIRMLFSRSFQPTEDLIPQSSILVQAEDTPHRISLIVAAASPYWLRAVAENLRRDRSRFTVLEEACLRQQQQIEWMGTELQVLQAHCAILAQAAGVPLKIPGCIDRFSVDDSRMPLAIVGCPFDEPEEEEEEDDGDATDHAMPAREVQAQSRIWREGKAPPVVHMVEYGVPPPMSAEERALYFDQMTSDMDTESKP